jgi:hypothetical protein
MAENNSNQPNDKKNTGIKKHENPFKKVGKSLDLFRNNVIEGVRRNVKSGYKKIFRDIEISKKNFSILLLIAIGATFLAGINFYYSGYLIDRSSFLGGTGLGLGMVVGLIISMFLIDRLERKFRLIAILFATSPILCILGIIFQNSIYLIIPVLIFSVNIIIAIILIFILLVIIVEYTTILERGRITAMIFSIDAVFTFIMYFFVANGYLGLVPTIVPLVAGIYLYKHADLEKNFTHFAILEQKTKSEQSKKKQKMETSSDEEKQKILRQIRLKAKKERSSKEFIIFLFTNSQVIMYLAVIFACGIIIGLLIPINEFFDSILIFQQSQNSLIIFAPIFITIGAFIIGSTFDIYGRKSAMSFIIYLVGIVNFLNLIGADQLGSDTDYSLFVALIFAVILAIPLLTGDISKNQFYGRTIIIFILLALLGLIVGVAIKDQYLVELLADNEFLFSHIASDIPTGVESVMLFNYSLASIIFLLCMTILFILANIASALSKEELNWPEKLIHLYIIHNSGLLLYDHSFKEVGEETLTADLISGGLIGLVSILKEITQGKTSLRIIDHGDKKLLFQWDAKEQVVFVMVIERELLIFRDKLAQFVLAFEAEFEKDLKYFAGVDDSKWVRTKDLIENVFSRKYMDWMPVMQTFFKEKK